MKSRITVPNERYHNHFILIKIISDENNCITIQF